MKGRKKFFFEKKEPKNFCYLGSEVHIPPSQTDKSLLLLFFRKEVLPF
jgi:hypothetical protein